MNDPTKAALELAEKEAAEKAALEAKAAKQPKKAAYKGYRFVQPLVRFSGGIVPTAELIELANGGKNAIDLAKYPQAAGLTAQKAAAFIDHLIEIEFALLVKG